MYLPDASICPEISFADDVHNTIFSARREKTSGLVMLITRRNRYGMEAGRARLRALRQLRERGIRASDSHHSEEHDREHFATGGR